MALGTCPWLGRNFTVGLLVPELVVPVATVSRHSWVPVVTAMTGVPSNGAKPEFGSIRCCKTRGFGAFGIAVPGSSPVRPYSGAFLE